MPNAKIIIVDDDADLVMALTTVLQSRQYTVDYAYNRADGMEKIKADTPDLAILDVMMDSWQDGFEMARELKADDATKDMPILMLTGVEGHTGIEFKSESGDPTWLPVDSFLDKPVEPDTLLAEVEKLLA